MRPSYFLPFPTPDQPTRRDDVPRRDDDDEPPPDGPTVGLRFVDTPGSLP